MKNSIERMYDVDPISKTVVISKTFAKKASLVNSTEFEHMKKLREEFADYTWSYRVIKRKNSKTTYKNLTYANMEKYIAKVKGEDSESITNLETIIKMAKIQSSPYAYAKSWFLENYPNYREHNAVISENAGNDSNDPAAA